MSPYGAGLDPTPYISAAYGIGILCLGGFALYVGLQRRRLKQMKMAIEGDSKQ